MRKSNAFRPTSLDSLESRIALSGAGLGNLYSQKVIDTLHAHGVDVGQAHHQSTEQGTHAHHTTHHHAEHHHHEHKPVK